MSGPRSSGDLVPRLRRWAARRFGRRRLVIQRSAPVVSFSFDDFPRSAWLNGGAVLSRHGLRGTYYVSLGLMDGETDLGPQFTVEDLKGVADAGHELGCHTFDHLDVSAASTRRLKTSVQMNHERLAALLPAATMKTFAYPFGRASLGAKRALARRFSCCRGVDARINVGVTDRGLLAAHHLYSRSIGIDRIRELIRDNRSLGGWLIFYTHDVRPDPSPFGCTPEYFEAVVEAVLAEEIAILPVGEAIDQISDFRFPISDFQSTIDNRKSTI